MYFRRLWEGWGGGRQTFSAKGQIGTTLGFEGYNYSNLPL